MPAGLQTVIFGPSKLHHPDRILAFDTLPNRWNVLAQLSGKNTGGMRDSHRAGGVFHKRFDRWCTMRRLSGPSGN